MALLTRQVLYDGREEPPPERVTLRAGPLSVVYDNGDLRYLRLGEREILRRVYAAVRDRHWGTVPPQLANVQLAAQPESFTIAYEVTNRQDGIDFFWRGTITGLAEGTIVFTFDGEARSTFPRNRIGFCVLHPSDLAGQPCTVIHVDGTVTEGVFPAYISPHQPFLNVRAIRHQVLPGVLAEVLMEGDTLEMEDQRNWTDASYKTYCTPLALPYPVTVEQGTRISQRVTIRLLGDAPRLVESPSAAALTVALDDQSAPLPLIGLGVASHGEPLSATAVARLKALHLSHLRVNVRLYDGQTAAVLKQAAEEARAIGARLEVAMWVSDDADEELNAFRQVVNTVRPLVVRWLIFHRGERSTGERWVNLARLYLADYDPEARLGAGTDAYFTELNRGRPPVEALDLVTYSLNPQVHSFSNLDLVETLTTQAVTVVSAQQFCGGKPIAVGPVTLKIRWNPDASGPEPPAPPGELPRQVDARQMSLFGAGWTMGSIKYLAEGGAHSLTYYETTGWLGVMERPEGSPLPDKFRSVPGGVFPMYHVFADVGEFAGGEVVICRSKTPLTVDSLVLRRDGRTRVLLANYTPEPQRVTVRGLSGALTVRSLDETNAEAAMRDPEAFRAEAGRPLTVGGDGAVVEMMPYAVVRLDGR